MQIPGNEQTSEGTEKSNQPYVDEHFQPDHPGKQDISRNPNPRANENLPETEGEPVKEGDSAGNDVGTEITDGEAG